MYLFKIKVSGDYFLNKIQKSTFFVKIKKNLHKGRKGKFWKQKGTKSFLLKCGVIQENI